MEQERSINTLTLDGGCLCLDFINTVHSRTVEEPFEYLSGYGELLDWAVKVEILTLSERKELESIAGENRGKAKKVLTDLIKARELLYDFFLPIAQNKTPNKPFQVQFNKLLTEAMSQVELNISDSLKARQQWKNKSDLKFPLFPVIKSAYDLLTANTPERIKECDACGWLFLDHSKNKSRKWCSMESCGSNVKAKRYYHRKKASGNS